jgi:hypothetical protein
MEIMFGLPLAVYAVVRFLETQRLRYLGAFLVVFWLQAIAVWYFAVILGMGLVVLTAELRAAAGGRAGARRRCWPPASAAWSWPRRWRRSPGRSS